MVLREGCHVDAVLLPELSVEEAATLFAASEDQLIVLRGDDDQGEGTDMLTEATVLLAVALEDLALPGTDLQE